MSASMEFHSSASSDAEVVAAFGKVAEELGQDPEHCRVIVAVMPGYTRNPEDITLSKIHDQSFVQVANENGNIAWESARLRLNPLQLDIVLRRNPETGEDVIRVSYRADPADPAEVGRAVAAVQRQFVPWKRAEAIERALGPEMAELYRRREEGLSRLEALTRRLVMETHEYRLRLDTEATEHRRELTDSFEERNRERDAKHEERSAELEAREQDLDRRRQELDDRSARHARREQSRALQQKISERSQKFSLTPDTQRKRQPIHAIFVVLLLVTGGLVAKSLLSPAVATSGVALWLELARLPLGLLGFGLTAVFYIRWNDRWFRQHADQEFRLQQLALDVDRAGYATEMLLEWQGNEGGEMPAVLVDRLTTGLFMDQTTVAKAQHPMEDVTGALLKASSGVRVDIPGIGEATIRGRGIRKLDKNLRSERGE